MQALPMTLQTKHKQVFTIRVLHPDAHDFINEVLGLLPSNLHWLPTIDEFWTDHLVSPAGIAAALESCAECEDEWFVCTRGTRGYRGQIIALARMRVDRASKLAYVGCWVCAEYAAMGIARTVLDSFVREAQRLEVKTLIMPVFSPQRLSKKAMGPLRFSLVRSSDDPMRECCWYIRSLVP